MLGTLNDPSPGFMDPREGQGEPDRHLRRSSRGVGNSAESLDKETKGS